MEFLLLFLGVPFLIWLFVVIIAAIINSTCPHCKRIFALWEITRDILKKEKISKLENHKRYDKNGRVTGSRDVRIYGTKITYNVLYLCKKCNMKCEKVISEEKY